ncbi:hypothetical protein COO55_38350 [Rhodococcus opacus]|nr:hypothetical protein COO55_38350 [Rhodococcus opacus]
MDASPSLANPVSSINRTSGSNRSHALHERVFRTGQIPPRVVTRTARSAAGIAYVPVLHVGSGGPVLV